MGIKRYSGCFALSLLTIVLSQTVYAAEEPQVLEEVSVTATREARAVREVPEAIAVVGKDKIEKKRMFNLKEALDGIPGVQAESKNGGSDVRLFIRGAGVKATYGIREIMILRDGVPVTDPDSLTRLDFIDMQDIERVEVTKGPGSIYSTGSFGGAVQIISKSVFDQTGNTLRLALGEQDARNAHLRFSGMATDKQALAITASFRAQDNPWRTRNKYDSKQLGIKHGLILDGATLESELTYADSKMQLPGGMDLAMFNQFLASGTQTAQSGIWANSKRDSNVWSFNSKYEKEMDDWTFKPRIYGNWWKHYHPVTGVINDTPNWTQTIGTDLEGQYKHHLGSVPGSLVAGLTLRQVSGKDARKYQYRDVTIGAGGRITKTLSDVEGALAERQDYTDTVKGIFLQESLRPNDRWLVDAGMRFDQSSFSMTTNEISKFNFATSKYAAGRGIYQTSKSFNLPSVKLGANFKASEAVNLYAAASRSDQLPANAEIQANPSLTTATSTNYEIGLKARAAEWAGNVTAYTNALKNEIVNVNAGGAATFVNAGKTQKDGLELDGSYQFVHGFEVGAQYNYSNYHYTSFSEPVGAVNTVRDGKQLPFIPKNKYGLFLGYKSPSGISARLQANYSGSYYTDNANSQTYEGYKGVINASLAYEQGPHTFNLSAENLTNKFYAAEVSKATTGVVTYTAASPRVVMATYSRKL